jgi:hypothetical protein
MRQVQEEQELKRRLREEAEARQKQVYMDSIRQDIDMRIKNKSHQKELEKEQNLLFLSGEREKLEKEENERQAVPFYDLSLRIWQFMNKIRNGYRTKDAVINNYAQLKAEEEKRRKQQEYALVEKAAEEMKQRQEREFQEKVRRQKQVIPIFRPSKVLHFKGQMNQETLGFIASKIKENNFCFRLI